MRCPACAVDMVTVKVQIVEIDRCPACGGVALEKGEAETIDALGLGHVIEGGVIATLQQRATPARCHVCVRENLSVVREYSSYRFELGFVVKQCRVGRRTRRDATARHRCDPRPQGR